MSGTGVVSASDIATAAERFAHVIPPSPLHRSERLSARYGLDVWLKREDQLAVRSYKARGAYNLIAQLSAEQQARGVVCASAGNHGQGVALACASLGVQARVYLPRTTPRQKRDKVRALGGEHLRMIVDGETFDDAAEAARQHSRAAGATLIPPFDDPRTIAGQGTVIKEAVEQLGHAPDAVVVPVGGGGLLAGTIAWLRETDPDVTIIGAEPQGAASMALALRAGHPETMTDIDSFVDGAAVRTVGTHTYAITARRPPTMAAVPEGRICVEMLDLYQSDGIISEPAGALASSALDLVPGLQPGATVVCVLSGGNNDVSRYAEIVERALVFEGRKHYFLVEFPQEPGALREFLDDVLGPDDDITLFEYVKRNNRETGPALVGIELGTPEDLDPMLHRMEKAPHRIERVPPDSPLFTFLT